MTARRALSLAAVLLWGVLAATASAAEGRFAAGTVELALKGGYSLNHPQSTAEAADGIHGLPHLGYFLTGERGAGPLRGSFELLVEPTVIRLDTRDSATLGGVAVLGRWVFAGSTVLHPYLEGGGGVLGGDVDLRQTNCETNFGLQGGVGVLVSLSRAAALTLGYRFHHVSNADLCSENLGLNSSLFLVGVSYFFR